MNSLGSGEGAQALEYAALRAELAGDTQGAVEARRELTRRDPQSPLARLALARALERAQDWRGATQAYLEALQRGAAGAELHLRLGELYARQSQNGQAMRHLKQVLAEQPDHAEALFALGRLLYKLRRYRDAAQHLEHASRQRPEAPQLHFNLGLALLEAGDLRGAESAFARSYAANRGTPWSAEPAAHLAREPAPTFAPEEMTVNDVKLRHDAEQLEYLLERGALPAAFRAVAEAYRELLAEVKGAVGPGVAMPFNVHRFAMVARTYKRPLHLASSPAPAGPVLNPRLDWKRLEKRYLGAKPNLVVVDDLLDAAALESLRRFCRESTIWNNLQAGYLGAYFFDGFSCGLLLRLARELGERFPRVIGGQPLQMMWGYKYDSVMQGIAVHADAAAVNLNFWITEDEANLDPEAGGLLVYPHAAPADWDFDKFNRDEAAIRRYLESAGSVPLRVPHRANRAVIFDSDLFHATDRLRFREGYANRRINITLLFGERGG